MVEERRQLKELHSKIWDVCCSFWGKMAADDYKDYVLGLLFYRYLSERTEEVVESLLSEDNMTYEEAWENEDYRKALQKDLLDITGFVIEPKYLFSKMYEMINIKKSGFDIEYLQKAVNSLMDSTLGQESQEAFDGIFEDMDLNSSKLGRNVASRSKLIKKALTSIGQIDFEYGDSKIDVLGDAYEYLISQFAASAGRKSGSFYTPAMVGELMARITTIDKSDVLNAFDGCGGSGSLLLTLKKHSDVRNLFYQELTTSTYNLARMNMLLHGVSYQNFHMANDDTLENPHFLDVEQDIVISNPPYSQKWSSDNKFMDDERFSSYGRLAPKSRADYSFLLSMFHSLKNDGVMAVVLPHGILFRGGAENVIRKQLIKDNSIDTVIGLPRNVFYGTSIPTVIIILKKEKDNNDVLFIDASEDFESGRNQNFLREGDIEKIVEVYKNREDVERYASVTSFEEIKENDFNLNIPRYVDTFEEEEPVDLKVVDSTLIEIDKEIEKIDEELEGYYKELGI